MMKKTILVDLTLFLIAFVWGTTFVLVENAVDFLPPFLFNSIRFFMAAVSLLLVLFFFYRSQLVEHMNLKLIGAGAILGLWLFSGYLFQTVGLVYTTSSKAGFITGLSVVLVPIFSIFLLKQSIRKNAVIGIILATVGLYLLTFGDISSLNIGDLLVFFCAISFAFQIVLTGKYAPHFATLILAFVQLSMVAILSTLGALITGEWKVLTAQPGLLLEPTVIWALLICVLPATVFAYVAQTSLQRHTNATRVALIFTLEPVFAALTDIWWNGSWLSTIGFIGCLFIFGGMIVSEVKLRKKNPSILQSKNVS